MTSIQTARKRGACRCALSACRALEALGFHICSVDGGSVGRVVRAWHRALVRVPVFRHPRRRQGAASTAVAVMTFVHAVAVFLFLLVWNGVLGKVSDFGRTFVRFRRISKWCRSCSHGGPIAIFGSYMAMGFAARIRRGHIVVLSSVRRRDRAPLVPREDYDLCRDRHVADHPGRRGDLWS